MPEVGKGHPIENFDFMGRHFYPFLSAVPPVCISRALT